MIYVSSDWHGCSPGEIQRLLDRAGFCDSDFLFVLGDVIDRGQHGAELLLWLSGMPNAQLIMGNHEAMMLACLFIFEEAPEETPDLTIEQRMLIENWMENGGSTTVSGLRRLLEKDPDSVIGILEYLQDCPLYDSVRVNNRDFILVHAGIGNFDPNRSLDAYDPQDLMMVRPSLSDRYYTDATVIFGHTPTGFYGTEVGQAVYTDSWICIDTGAAMGYTPMLLRLDDMKEFH